MSTKSVRVELSEKFLSLPRHGDIILNSMTQTREKWDSHVLSRPDFCMVWICHGIPCVHFYFLFRTNVRKRYLDESDFHHCYGNFLESVILKVTWSHLCSKFLLNNYEAHWQEYFERDPKVENFTDKDQDTF